MVHVGSDVSIAGHAGDVVGIHYPSGASAALIPYESLSSPPLCCDLSSDHLSRVHTESLHDNDLSLDHQLTSVATTQKMLPALNPFIGLLCFPSQILLIIPFQILHIVIYIYTKYCIVKYHKIQV